MCQRQIFWDPPLVQNSLFWGPSCARIPYSGAPAAPENPILAKVPTFLRNQTNRPFCGFENPISGLENPILGARSAPQRLVSISRILGLHFGKSGGFFYFFTFYFPEKNFPRFARFFSIKICKKNFAFRRGEKLRSLWGKKFLTFPGRSSNFPSWA